MNLISWNCRGLAAASTVQELKDLCLRVKPVLLFLMETRAKYQKVEEIRRKLHFDYVCCVEPEGLSGGLSLLWSKKLEIEVVDTCKNYIHTFCKVKEDGDMWDATFVYGNPKFSERRYLWDELSRLHTTSTSPWMCIGDFNEILSQEEKIGLRPHCPNKIHLFKQFVDEAGLMDMEIKGCRFTWMSNPRNGFITKERIDRLLVNWEWRQIYPNAIVTATPPISSDHSPLILTCKPKVGDGGLFKYEMYLEDHEDCHRVIDEGWNVEQFDEDPWGNLLGRFQSCKRTLTKWDKEQFKNAAQELSKLKRRLAQLLNTVDSEVNYVEVNELKEKIKKLWDHEEKYWGQRSRLKWIKWGDRNTKFFHASTIQRRDRNRIQRLKNSNGEWVEGQEEVTKVI